jgi:OPT family oligopeptide transporter
MSTPSTPEKPHYPGHLPVGEHAEGYDQTPPLPTGVHEVPTLPENATPEQKDEHWLKYVYRGDKERQLTLRAVLMGGVLGMFMSISNLYTTLQLGWAFGVAITACVMSYVLWNVMRFISGNRLSQMSLLENNCMQSTASAAGYSTGGTVGSAVAAIMLVTHQHMPWYLLVPFVLCTAALGILLAVPLKRQMLNYEQLKFPSGIAAAETLHSLYSHGAEAVRKAYALVLALVAGGLVGLLRQYGDLVEQLRKTGRPQLWLERINKAFYLPQAILLPAILNPIRNFQPSSFNLEASVKSLQLQGYNFEPSVLLVGAGMIVGVRVSLSMFVGSVLLYCFLTPWLLSMDAAAIQSGVEHYVASIPIENGVIKPTRWALWGGTAIMVFSSLTSVAFQWRTFLRAFAIFKKKDAGQAQTDSIAHIEVPTTWFIVGMIPVTIGMVIVQYLAFHISIPLGVIAVALSLVVALVCCRATGETDTTPIGAMGKITQLLYAVLPGAAGNTTINLAAAGATSAAGGSAADLLTVLKTGYLVGSNSRKQFIAMMTGTVFGAAAIVPAWYLMVPTQEKLEKYNLISARMWKAVADLLTQGVHMLPKSAVVAILIGAFLGILFPLIEKLWPKTRNWMPSAMGLGLAMVIPFNNALAFAVGAIITWVWTKFHPKTADNYNVPIASGLVAGEALIAAIIAILCTLAGFMPAK